LALGLGYIVPVATLVKWFPDKRGMITGLAVAGFGAGALITAPIATRAWKSLQAYRATIPLHVSARASEHFSLNVKIALSILEATHPSPSR
jgi:MFS family permease